MLTLIMYAICFGLFLKGVQILQIAIVSTGAWRKKAMQIGMTSFLITTVVAVWLAVWFTMKAWDFDRQLLEILAGPPPGPFR